MCSALPNVWIDFNQIWFVGIFWQYLMDFFFFFITKICMGTCYKKTQHYYFIKFSYNNFAKVKFLWIRTKPIGCHLSNYASLWVKMRVFSSPCSEIYTTTRWNQALFVWNTWYKISMLPWIVELVHTNKLTCLKT